MDMRAAAFGRVLQIKCWRLGKRGAARCSRAADSGDPQPHERALLLHSPALECPGSLSLTPFKNCV